MKRINTGIVGLGRSGWGIHAKALSNLQDQYCIHTVFDPIKARCKEAEEAFKCKSCSDYSEFLSDNNLELVVITSPTPWHFQQAVDAIKAGKHVVIEKPAVLETSELDDLIQWNKKSCSLVTVYQNYRYARDYLKIREILDSGILGEIIQIKMTEHYFQRRWDWQTMKSKGGGILLNLGSHRIDWALQMLKSPPDQIHCYMKQTPLFAGNAESHVKIILKTKNRPLVDIELTYACSYPQSNWLIMGTAGTLCSDRFSIRLKYYDPEKMPDLVVDPNPTPDRSYNEEAIPFIEETFDIGDPYEKIGDAYYRDLYKSITYDKQPKVTLESVLHQMHVLKRCCESL